MGQRFLQWSALCVAVGVAFLQQSAEAGEPRAEVGSLKSAVGRPAFATATAFRGIAFAKTYTVATPWRDTTTGQPAAGRKEERGESEPASRPQHKTITFFRFTTSKLGEVSVQPVVGGVNGAQLSIGF